MRNIEVRADAAAPDAERIARCGSRVHATVKLAVAPDVADRVDRGRTVLTAEVLHF